MSRHVSNPEGLNYASVEILENRSDRPAMKLVLLGTTGYHPSDERHTACMMLPDLGIVFDAGTGMFRARDYLSTRTLDVFISHAHLDHIIGLTFLLDVLQGRTMERVTVHGMAEKLAAIERHLLADDLFPVPLPCEYRPLDAPVQLSSGVTVAHFPLKHPGGSVGFRLSADGRSLAYVTDTTASPDAPYIEQIRGVDTLVHECYFPDDQEEFARHTGHSCITPVVQLAKAADVGRLVLVHIDPLSTGDDPLDLAKARSIFPRTEVGYDRMEIEV